MGSRREKVLAIAELIEAAGKKAADPDKYREEHGKCPRGYSWDGEHCVKRGAPKEEKAPPEEKPPEEKPPEKSPEEIKRQQKLKEKLKQKRQTQEKEKQKLTPEQMGRKKQKRLERKAMEKELGPSESPKEKIKKELDHLAKTDFKQYRKMVDGLRKAGKLPDKKTATFLAETAHLDPERLKKMPPAMRAKLMANPLTKKIMKARDKIAKGEPIEDKDMQKLVDQQKNQAEHEERVLKATTKYLHRFLKDKEMAEELGKKPPVLNPVKMRADIEKMIGRPIKEPSKNDLAKLRRVSKQAATKPGEATYRVSKWLEQFFKPVKPWVPFWKPSASVESSMKKSSIINVLDEVAEALEARGAVVLAQEVDKCGFPLADELSDAPVDKPWNRDTKIQMTNFQGNIGFPPYRVKAAARPSQREINKLVELFAKQMYAGKQKADMKTQQRLYDAFKKYHEQLSGKFPDVDMESDAFWKSLESQAEKWISKQAFRGPGSTW